MTTTTTMITTTMTTTIKAFETIRLPYATRCLKIFNFSIIYIFSLISLILCLLTGKKHLEQPKCPKNTSHSSFETKKSGEQFPQKVIRCIRHYKPKLILPLKPVLLYHIPFTLKIHQRTLRLVKNSSNKKTDTTLQNQLFEIYNFAL